MSTKQIVTLKRLKQLLHYDPDTGLFIWLRNRGNTALKGTVAGGKNNIGYILISVDSTQVLAHRLAWFYVHGEFARAA